jgi:hypothetical protein
MKIVEKENVALFTIYNSQAMESARCPTTDD